jgi:hypothetical protein
MARLISRTSCNNDIEVQGAYWNSRNKNFNNVDYNVGWQLQFLGTPQPNKIHTESYHYTTYKVCMGAVKCINAGCELLNKGDTRPRSTEKGIVKQTCALCKEKMEHVYCNTKITFEHRLATITVKHKGMKEDETATGDNVKILENGHAHGQYAQKHLTFDERKNRNAYVKKYPTITPKQAVVGLSAKTGIIVKTAQDAISDLMANKGRLKYELGVGDLFGSLFLSLTFYMSLHLYCKHDKF